MIPWLGGGGAKENSITVSNTDCTLLFIYFFSGPCQASKVGTHTCLEREAQASEIFVTFLLHFHVCGQPSHTCAQTMAQLFKKYL